MTTAHQTFPRQVLRPAHGPFPRRPEELPEPGERRRLREQWGLSTRQVARAFGVTPATVRSWESGRSTPRGARREAYRRFLAGLAQHTGPDAGPPAATARPGRRRPAANPSRTTRTSSDGVTPGGRPDAHGSRPTGHEGAGSLRVKHVGRDAADPVSPRRIRRLRLLGVAACTWSLAWWVVLTCPPPL
ncbi:helix-turn-helix domain-containing protein [Streptomyces sp. NPDC058052]|uniref:helix-turn-helix domain-containing protein n=1 Tax=Streptomyces sp. NPDC058052 TaxID=3346316 RepID=UPI0036E910C5